MTQSRDTKNLHLPRGLYETLITEELAQALARLDQDLVKTADISNADATDRFARHLDRIVRRVLESLSDEHRVPRAMDLGRELLETMQRFAREKEVTHGEGIKDPPTVLRAVKTRLPDGRTRAPVSPLTPLLDTALLTNAPGEPRVGHEVHAEIESADRIDLVMAFIRFSGIRPLLEALATHCRQRKPLRVITTIYTGTTEGRALTALRDIGADIRVSYDVLSTRLHAKAWHFHRDSGFSTAYVGSSNLTHSAQVSGLEWNVRIAAAKNPEVVKKIEAVFETYWNSPDFSSFDPEEFEKQTRGRREESLMLSPIELRPEPFQERLLELIRVSRGKGFHANLLVSATGTGKTVMAALDYAHLRQELPRARLLFVAHRKEILTQSLMTFRHALREASFGELWVNGSAPEHFEHVFASIQSITAASLEHLSRDHFDVVIVDEFHHAAAKSYTALLEHVRPRELLGLTATPERTDGLPVLSWFGDRISAELRLWDAIDQRRLVPFVYYGIHDGLDLRAIPWRRGQGYDVEGLTNLITANDVWARSIVKQVAAHVDSPSAMRALAFCVSVEHARFMARVFQDAGIASLAVWGDSPREEREAALRDLESRKVNVLFSVDLFNEGIDVPSVDTLLLLRPTDSATLFLQQLGRGLRRSANKDACTVLDFVGQHRKEFSFTRRLGALLGGTRKSILEQVEAGFPYLPAGCHMELDSVASKIVIDNIRSALPSTRRGRTEELRAVASHLGRPPRLKEFLTESGMTLDDIYVGNNGWTDLLADAGLATAPAGPHEESLRRACARLLHVDDADRLDAYVRFVSDEKAKMHTVTENRYLRMLVGSLLDQVASRKMSLVDGFSLVWQHPQVLSEVHQLCEVLSDGVSHLQFDLPEVVSCPLRVHARYTRIEILAAIGVGDTAKTAPWQTGIYWAEEANCDLLAFTLDKSDGQFSPTTRYRDYAISRQLIHWESQSVTRQASETGRRYQLHAQRGSHILLFARLRQDDRAFWFLGPATYVGHEGERPMAITWRLKHALPGDLFAAFAAAVA